MKCRYCTQKTQGFYSYIQEKVIVMSCRVCSAAYNYMDYNVLSKPIEKKVDRGTWTALVLIHKDYL